MIVCTQNILFALIQQHINNHVAPSDMQRLAMKDLIVNRTSIVPWVLNQIRELEVSIEYDQSTMKTCPIWNVPLNAEVDRNSIPPFQKGQFLTNVSLFYLE